MESDGAASLHYYRLAADRKHTRAKEALERTEQQVKTKEAAAQFQHGKALLEQWRQTGLTEKMDEAIECFTSSADLDHHDSKYELALLLLYKSGQDHLMAGAEQGFELAEQVFELAKPAADAHHPNAAHLCAQLRLAHWSNVELCCR